MKCPKCAGDSLEIGQYEMAEMFQGHPVVVRNLPASRCRHCGHLIVEAKIADRIQRALASGDTHSTTQVRVYDLATPAAQYCVQGLGKDHPLVELWSTTRLPFEPKGWLAEMRSDLRSALAGLCCGAEEMLQATFASAITGAFDIENVLFYNVGSAHFRTSATGGIRFERSFAQPSAPPRPMSGAAAHHHSYAAAPRNGSYLWWRPGRTLLAWDPVDIPSLSSTTNPAWVWWAMQGASWHPPSITAASPARFGLRVTLYAGRKRGINISALVKPLFDGVIAAFHAHDGTQLANVSPVVARLLGVDSTTVASRLMGTDVAALGTRLLLWPRANGVQWNPADDGCVAAELLLENCEPGGKWSIAGELFEVEPLGGALPSAKS